MALFKFASVKMHLLTSALLKDALKKLHLLNNVFSVLIPPNSAFINEHFKKAHESKRDPYKNAELKLISLNMTFTKVES